ncbi:ROK family protein [Ruminococcaceae bacterium OttesenSCG-928-D13]|nr:ROK family protein [Ruminococcaceae bacterium OttesenSCG-928-D13]
MKTYLGIDLGGTNIVAGMMDSDYKLLGKFHLPTEGTRGFEAVVASMAEAAAGVLKVVGVAKNEVDCIGLGVPSSINPETRRMVYANNLGWKNADVISEFKKHWDLPVYIANDADCAVLGETVAGAAKNYQSALLVTLGTGVGGGLVIGGKLFLGGDGFSIEPGHGLLVEDGFPCTCGRRGCIESYASVTALIRQSVDMMMVDRHSLMWKECGGDLNRVNGRTAFDAAKKGDAAGQAVVDQYIKYLGDGIASLVTVYRPNAVLIGGGVSNEGEYLLKPLREHVHRTYFAHETLPAPALLKAELGNDAGVIGAAALGLQE